MSLSPADIWVHPDMTYIQVDSDINANKDSRTFDSADNHQNDKHSYY